MASDARSPTAHRLLQYVRASMPPPIRAETPVVFVQSGLQPGWLRIASAGRGAWQLPPASFPPQANELFLLQVERVFLLEPPRGRPYRSLSAHLRSRKANRELRCKHRSCRTTATSVSLQNVCKLRDDGSGCP